MLAKSCLSPAHSVQLPTYCSGEGSVTTLCVIARRGTGIVTTSNEKFWVDLLRYELCRWLCNIVRYADRFMTNCTDSRNPQTRPKSWRSRPGPSQTRPFRSLIVHPGRLNPAARVVSAMDSSNESQIKLAASVRSNIPSIHTIRRRV